MTDQVFRVVKRFIQSLDNAKYTDNQSISWGGQVIDYTIANWENVKPISKLDIEEKALIYGLEKYP